jgi:hypothetical protein
LSPGSVSDQQCWPRDAVSPSGVMTAWWMALLASTRPRGPRMPAHRSAARRPCCGLVRWFLGDQDGEHAAGADQERVGGAAAWVSGDEQVSLRPCGREARRAPDAT